MGHQPQLSFGEPASQMVPAPFKAQYWRLGPGLTACLSIDRILLLNTATDRYSALPADQTHAFLCWVAERGEAPPSSLAASLLRAGAGTAGDELTPTRCVVEMPRALDAQPLASCPFSMAAYAGVARCVAKASYYVRSRRLERALVRRPAHGRIIDRQSIAGRLATFRSLRPLVPVRRVCLHDCIALMNWIGWPDGAQLVLGVSAYPFAAHSWVQLEGRVIDDHPDSPSRFQPILHLG